MILRYLVTGSAASRRSSILGLGLARPLGLLLSIHVAEQAVQFTVETLVV